MIIFVHFYFPFSVHCYIIIYTYEERIEIVAFCIANANDYNLTANKYKVSYQQVYTWINKYNRGGYEALVDRRGKRKKLEDLSESEKIAAQLKLLESENRQEKEQRKYEIYKDAGNWK